MRSRSDGSTLNDEDVALKSGLSAQEVDRRLLTLARAHRRVESALCFYLQEVEERELYRRYGHASTVDYARERLGLEDRKTWSLLQLARRLKVLPELKKAFGEGKIPWTKAREAARAATPETDKVWVKKCETLSNRQLEHEVQQSLPPVKKKTLFLVLENEMLEVWQQAREACERLAGKTLSDLEVFDLMCAEVLCTFAATPAFDPEDEDDGGFVRTVAERDGWRCTRPGCSCRSGLQGNHIIPRSQGGPDEDWNKHTVCAACHLAITEGRLKVSGRAPDGVTWEGPFGVIEKPLPLARPEERGGTDKTARGIPSGHTYSTSNRKPSADAMGVREAMALYGSQPFHLGSPDRRKSDHVITRDEEHGPDGYRIHTGGIRSHVAIPAHLRQGEEPNVGYDKEEPERLAPFISTSAWAPVASDLSLAEGQ